MNSSLKPILVGLLNRLSDAVASLDALELQLVESGVLQRDAVHNRFRTHKETVELHLLPLRLEIAALPE
jgi:hypothetical protein